MAFEMLLIDLSRNVRVCFERLRESWVGSNWGWEGILCRGGSDFRDFVEFVVWRDFCYLWGGLSYFFG